jgi:hypothetical protein
MNSLVLYVNAGVTAPTPVFLSRNLHPFGQQLGVENTTFTNFMPVANFSEAIFDLGPDYKYECSDPEPDDSCNSPVCHLGARAAGWQLCIAHPQLRLFQAVKTLQHALRRRK